MATIHITRQAQGFQNHLHAESLTRARHFRAAGDKRGAKEAIKTARFIRLRATKAGKLIIARRIAKAAA